MYKPRRSELAKFLPTQELIRAFEQLFDQSASTDAATIAAIIANLTSLSNTVSAIQLDLEDVAIDAGTTDAKANLLSAELARIADALQLLALAPRDEAIRLPDDVSPPYVENRKPVMDYIDFALLPAHTAQVARVVWNSDDDTLNLHHSGGVTQQIGAESYLRFLNGTGSTIPNGSAVGLDYVGGVTTDDVVPYIADGSIPTLNIIGVTTQDVPDGEYGRVTVWGRVRDIDTTGTPYSETWAQGDVLYASPSTAGGLTNVKPTAPDACIPLAVVVIANATTGAIFVRPTIEQQQYYGEAIKTTDQTPAVVNTAYAITFDSLTVSNGVSLGTPASRVVVANSGLYNFAFNVQVTSNNANLKNVWTWFRKNGTDIADTSFIFSSDMNGGYAPLSRTEFFSLDAGDYIEVMFASDDTGVTIDAIAATAFAPAAPAAGLSVTMVQQ